MEEKRYDVDLIHNLLIRFTENERDIDNQIERLEHIKVRLEGVGAQVLTDMPKSHNVNRDRYSDLIDQKDELELHIRAAIKAQNEERNYFESILAHLKNPDEKAVIRMRYFDQSSWNDVRDMLFSSKSDFEGKEDSYLRRAHRLHGAALLKMQMYIQDHEGKDTADSVRL